MPEGGRWRCWGRLLKADYHAIEIAQKIDNYRVRRRIAPPPTSPFQMNVMTEQTLTAPIDDRQESSRGFSRDQSIPVALMALVQFTIIIDFTIMSSIGAIIIPALDISAGQFGLAVSAYAFSAGSP
jgi:hypothetical protein